MKKKTKKQEEQEEQKQEEQIKSLTWDKFWKYKISEIMGLLIFILIPYYVGLFIYNLDSVITNWFFADFSVPYSLGILWTVGFVGIIVLAGIVAIPIFWIVINWKKAKENAEDEVTGEERCYW
ncbi:hypothetical protein LCGC14_0556430 [marine sediment metagenome]|uniref:Uncharacterized protein n=1 Tax=marine sediment metagenome TaxID=412755 RepID=A0A0F9RN60_9ZZZZ